MLFLCQNLPYPPDSGVLIRTYHVLRILSREFSVRALCFYRAADRPDGEQVRASVAALGRLAEVEAFAIPQEHSRARFVFDHLRSVARGRAYTAFAYASRAFRLRLREVLAEERFDLVHVDSLDLAGYLPELRGLPVVCVHHNVESALLRRRAAQHHNPLVRGYLRLQARLVEREERAWGGRVALNVTVSPDDRAELERLVGGGRWAVVPNGVDTRAFHPSPGGGDVVFMGGSNWFPNTEAMLWFCGRVLPLLREAGVDAPVRWIGRATDELRERFRRDFGVDVTGYVPDVRPYFERAGCVIVPLRSGGGTRLKILDAWGAGKAVVSTSLGCEGLDA
ncbi:MAG TPA: glycosyltransferase, partial [Longimicrobiaceae bacterium]